MRQFLLYGHVLSTEEAELYADYELKKNPPTLSNFKDQVCSTFIYDFVNPDLALHYSFPDLISFCFLHSKYSCIICANLAIHTVYQNVQLI